MYTERATTTSVVVPARNEARNIGWVLERIPLFVGEVVLVDGDSSDGTVEAARRVRPDIRVVGQERPGKGAALRAGFAAATGDYVVMLDADGSMDPGEIERFVAALDRGADMVKGSRFLPAAGTADMTGVRRWGNGVLLMLLNLLYGSRFTDLCYGFCAFRRTALARLGLRSDGFEIETEMVARAIRARISVVEVPSFESPRRFGESNLSVWRDGRRVLRMLLRARFEPAGVPAAGTVEVGVEPAGAIAEVAVDAQRA
ncbi:MAG TPA: glycosyltransferase family 2 protein [Solirubrobacteraceae bacterium]|nr:glycosyltransferase family 2 protein [Solirubrobacteraceae bacterium]